MGREFKKANVQDFEEMLIALHCIYYKFTASKGLGVARAAALGIICFKNFITVYHEHFSSRLCVGS